MYRAHMSVFGLSRRRGLFH
uniref:Uncharacterized protein n=1 Tax=Arundo donax TaxID=35708 RepID=A0A0A9AFL1_ARUDO